MAIVFHVHDNIVCKYVCHTDCSEYDGTCTNCVQIKLGVNRGKFACVHIKGHISEEDVTHLVHEIIHAHS
jgi:hypothetical protein